ncbi:hypothetical protein [Streptomyces sp. NPDC058092]|uniref:hypothetical protein n=1 Tax=Streptomyces sp. NPDC058092 TaxID=3346336 RepID=UPI0036EAA540
MTPQEAAALKFPAPFWPYGRLVTIAFMIGIVIVLGFYDSTRIALVVGVVWLALLTGVHYLWIRPGRPRPEPPASAEAEREAVPTAPPRRGQPQPPVGGPLATRNTPLIRLLPAGSAAAVRRR